MTTRFALPLALLMLLGFAMAGSRQALAEDTGSPPAQDQGGVMFRLQPNKADDAPDSPSAPRWLGDPFADLKSQPAVPTIEPTPSPTAPSSAPVTPSGEEGTTPTNPDTGTSTPPNAEDDDSGLSAGVTTQVPASPTEGPVWMPLSTPLMREVSACLHKHPQLSLLATVVDAFGVPWVPEDAVQITLLAPTNSAWDALTPGRLEWYVEPSRQIELRKLLQQHTLPTLVPTGKTSPRLTRALRTVSQRPVKARSYRGDRYLQVRGTNYEQRAYYSKQLPCDTATVVILPVFKVVEPKF
jgi:hypothetical protein